MSATIYTIHQRSTRLCEEAFSFYRQLSVESICAGVRASITARVDNLVAFVISVSKLIKSPVTLIGRVLSIASEEPSQRMLVRLAITVGCVACLTIGRLVVSLGGILAPELFYGFLRLHRPLLWLGLYCRVQTHTFPEDLSARIDREGDQVLRRAIVRLAMARMSREEHRTNSEGGARVSFKERIWEPTIRSIEAGKVSVARLVALATMPKRHTIASPITASGLQSLAQERSVSFDEVFFPQFIANMHTALAHLIERKIFTDEEAYDGLTALYAVLDMALLDLIVSHCSLGTAGRVLYDHQFFQNIDDFPGLEEALADLRAMYEDLYEPQQAEEETARLWMYFCGREERARELCPQLLERSPKITEFFKALVAFRYDYIETQLQSMSQSFQEVFKPKE